MDPLQSQDPSMEDDGLQSELPVVEIAALKHGLQGEVIVLLHVLFVCIFMTMKLNYRYLYSWPLFHFLMVFLVG